MGITDLLGKKQQPATGGTPSITAIMPPAALPEGEVRIYGRALLRHGQPSSRPRVTFNGIPAHLTSVSDDAVIARVPANGESGKVIVTPDSQPSNAFDFKVAVQIAEGVNPVANPAVDSEGNIYTTLSGSRGEETPVSVFKIDADFALQSLASGITNATGLAVGSDGQLYVSSRNDGSIYRIASNGASTVHAQGMGVATGIAFDREGNLYAGDRSGTIFKISHDREIYVFATLEPSVAAYHLAFDYADNLYVAAPTITSSDSIKMIAPDGEITDFYRGIGRPQGMAFDNEGNLFVAGSLHGRRGIVRITPSGEAVLVVAGFNIVGLAFTPTATCIIATNSALYQLTLGVRGKLPGGID